MTEPTKRQKIELANKLVQLAESHEITRDEAYLAQCYSFALRTEEPKYKDIERWYQERKR